MADSHSQKLEHILRHGLDLFDLDIRGKSVLLKPNLVDPALHSLSNAVFYR